MRCKPHFLLPHGLLQDGQAVARSICDLYDLVGGDLDAAIDWYERAIEQRQPKALLLGAAGYMKAVRSSLRRPKLAKMMNLA